MSQQKDPHAQALGRKGGSVRSRAKTLAARANAKQVRPRRCRQGGMSDAEWRAHGL